jgi:hypothetical protein
MENPMARRTYARFYYTIAKSYLKKEEIVNLAVATLDKQVGDPKPANLKKQLTTQGKSLVVPDNGFVALVGTTRELKEFRDGLTGIDEFRCKSGDQLQTWCVRVAANHPDHVVSESTLTLLVIGRAKEMGDTPKAPWRWFGVRRQGVSTKLDEEFDEALDAVAEIKAVNA